MPPTGRFTQPRLTAATVPCWPASRSCRWRRRAGTWIKPEPGYRHAREGGHPVRRAVSAQSPTPRNTGSSAFADDDDAMERAPSSSLLQIILHLLAQHVPQVGARHAEGDVGAEEAGLGAAIVALALELDAVETLGLCKTDHRIGELDLAAGAAALGFQDREDFRLQDVASGDRQI